MDKHLGVKPAIEILSARDFIALQNQIVEIYGAAFMPPPYAKSERTVRQFAAILSQHAERSGFRSVVARGDRDGEIVGFAYGYTSQPGQWWYDQVARALDRERTVQWLTNAFELVEIAVKPERQGEGIGGALHDMALQGVPHRTAVLSTLDAETAGLQLYRKRGWQILLSAFYFPNVSRAYLIMGRKLPLEKQVVQRL